MSEQKKEKEHVINPDLFYSTPEDVKKSLKKNEQTLKQTIKKYLPEPAKHMLDTTEGTVFLIALAFVIFVVFYKIIGMFFSLTFRIVFIIAVILIIYFLFFI